jgi:hypothetical protein
MPSLREIQMRDPFVLREPDAYYLIGTTDPDIWQGPGVGFDAYRSVSPDDLAAWEGPFPAFRPPAGFWSSTNFWAPEVHRVDGSYYMFATFLPNRGRRGTAVLRAGAPAGPYVPWSDGPVTPPDWECLDGTLHMADDGTPWLVFCHEWLQAGDGRVCAVPLAADLRGAAGEPVVLFGASQAPWSAQLRGEPEGSYVTDGPFLFRDGAGGLSMLWSSYAADGRYCIGQARSGGGVLGPWHQAERPIYAEDAGHGMLFAGPAGRTWLAIHSPNTSPDERPIFVEVDASGEWLAATGAVIS